MKVGMRAKNDGGEGSGGSVRLGDGGAEAARLGVSSTSGQVAVEKSRGDALYGLAGREKVGAASKQEQ